MANCRGCHASLPTDDTLIYRNMPQGAQAFLSKEELAGDTGVDIHLVQCPWCGLVQATGEPVDYYRDVIRASDVSAEMRTFREEQYKEWVNAFGLNGKTVLEVGCGRGEYIPMMESAGCNVIGLEHFPENIKKANDVGYNVIEGFIENESTVVEGHPFAGFYTMNFLEHIPDPGSFLRGIANNLTEDGVGLVEVPNFDMILRKSLYSEFIQDHVSYFTEDTLTGLLERNGFKVISCNSIWYDYILSARVIRRKGINPVAFDEMHKKLRSEVLSFLQEEKKSERKVAVWGAGHQALANLSLLEMKDYVECVIDSAEFKQGKFTPVTHLEILPPETLTLRNIDTVLIMAGGFSEEIKHIILKDYPNTIPVILSEEGLMQEK